VSFSIYSNVYAATEKLTKTIPKVMPKITLTHGIDTSAGNVSTYIITTPSATYFLEKQGGGLSSIVDNDGIDWLGFHNKKGSGWQGEYRGFPNAVHKQDGNYFHALNANTDQSTSVITIESEQHIQIEFTSGSEKGKGKWQARWDFYPDRLDFTMNKVSEGHHYWVLYEGVPYGAMDATDFWYSSADSHANLIAEPLRGELPFPKWIAFGDINTSRMIYVLNHSDDKQPDIYESRPYMTVFGFGRSGKNKYLNSVQTFSFGFVESNNYDKIKSLMQDIVTGNQAK